MALAAGVVGLIRLANNRRLAPSAHSPAASAVRSLVAILLVSPFQGYAFVHPKPRASRRGCRRMRSALGCFCFSLSGWHHDFVILDDDRSRLSSAPLGAPQVSPGPAQRRPGYRNQNG